MIIRASKSYLKVHEKSSPSISKHRKDGVKKYWGLCPQASFASVRFSAGSAPGTIRCTLCSSQKYYIGENSGGRFLLIVRTATFLAKFIYVHFLSLSLGVYCCHAGADLDCRTGRTCDSHHSAAQQYSNLYYIKSALRWIFLFALSR